MKNTRHRLLFSAWLMVSAAAATLILLREVRHTDEYMYVLYAESVYLPGEWKKNHRWPRTLDGGEKDLERRGDQLSKKNLATQRAGKPRLRVLSTTETTFNGEIRFLWWGGRAYSVDVKARVRPLGGP